MDDTAVRLITQLRDLELKRKEIDSDIEAIKRSLELAGVRPNDEAGTNEEEYAKRRPFKRGSLIDACLTVLKDSAYESLTKSQIEYLVSRGGFAFEAKDSKNSVAVTLRRLAESGQCEVESRGKSGNLYRYKRPIQKTPDAGAA